MKTLSAVLIVTNEERTIERCLKSIVWADEIIIVDGGSADQTVALASKYTQKIFERKLDDFSNQKNFAVEKASGDWIFSIDADEMMTPELAQSIQRLLSAEQAAAAYTVRRQNLIFGRGLRFGGQGEEKIVRLFRRGKARFTQKVHETLSADGVVGHLSEGCLAHDSLPDLDTYFRKLQLYTDLEARELFECGVKFCPWLVSFKAFARFLYFYLIRLGFLDGYEGFLFHSLSSIYFFLKYAKLHELYKQKSRA